MDNKMMIDNCKNPFYGVDDAGGCGRGCLHMMLIGVLILAAVTFGGWALLTAAFIGSSGRGDQWAVLASTRRSCPCMVSQQLWQA